MRTRSRLPLPDLVAEALAGVLQRPGRSALTALGTLIGVATFVTVLGLTATAGGQISARFTALSATEVTVEDTSTDPVVDGAPFPQDATGRLTAIDGVVHAGAWWSAGERLASALPPAAGADGRGAAAGSGADGSTSGVADGGDGFGARRAYPVLAAAPGAVAATRPTLAQGRLYDTFHADRAEPVALLGRTVAERLGISRLDNGPAVFIDDVPFTVVGIVSDVHRRSELLLSIVVPDRTALRLWGLPSGGDPMRMIVETRLGAARVVADQAAVALRPHDARRLRVIAPPDPRTLRRDVTSDLDALFLALAALCLVVGAVGIANTTFVAVLERVPEIGLRRALGARPVHVAVQFLTESATLGALGGLVGSCVGVATVLTVALARDWTAVMSPWVTLSGPLVGTATGVLAGLYPSIKASRIVPVRALSR